MIKKSIFFDFDGVIKDSTDVKTQAFYSLYLPFGEDIAEKAKTHHIENGGVSRFEKFNIYHKEFLGIELSEKEIDTWASKFSELVKQEVIQSDYVKGALETIQTLYEDYNLFIITGTPQEEIMDIANSLEITKYFVEICGSPNNKIYWSQYLMDKYNLDNKNITFVGDAMSDFKAAEAYDYQFILREHEENMELFTSYIGMVKIKNLTELKKHL